MRFTGKATLPLLTWIAFAVAAGCLACASGRLGPASNRNAPNPYAGRADAALAGRKLFRYHCAQCHGADAQGSSAAPSLRTQHVRTTPPGDLSWLIANGDMRHGMPSWSRLPEERRWQLVTYLKSLRE